MLYIMAGRSEVTLFMWVYIVKKRSPEREV
jgi:hypothetical protein